MTSEASADTARWILFDRVEIDLTGRRLFVDGQESPLEPKAFAVLALLARQPGRALTRDEILDAVWGHRHVTPGVLNRIVTLLRRALGETADRKQYLHTLYGIGYRFDAPVRFSSRRASEGPGDATVQAAPEPAPAPEIVETVDPPSAPASPRRFAHAMLALCLVAVLGIAGWMLRQRASSADSAPLAATQQGIAVLPLVNANGDASQQFFADGISENLINTLSQYEGLKVIGRGPSFRFRDSKEDPRAIGAKLGVAHLIEGSVQRDGDDVRIGIELIRSADGSTVWTRRFDKPYKDLFALQDEVALAVAGALQVKLMHAMPGAVDTGLPTSSNLAAYEAYLHGTYYMNSGRWRDADKAIDYFAQAAQLDPAYAQAWSWLGFMRTLRARSELSGDAARAVYAQAREDIETALRLQPSFGQAHAIRANLLSTADHDWNGALAEFRVALALVSETDPTHGAISRLLSTLGRVSEAIVERRKYIDGDPLAGFARVYLAELLACQGRLAEAHASLRDAAAVDPDQRDAYASGRAYLAVLRGDAITARREAEAMTPGRWQDRTLALAHQVGTDPARADAALRRLLEADDQVTGDAYAIARIYALRGDADKAFEWLQRDWERGGSGVHFALFDPLLLRFRDDPRFAAYCTQAGLPPPSQSEALSLDQIRARLALQS